MFLAGDPRVEIGDTTHIEWVMRRGVRHNPAELRAQYD